MLIYPAQPHELFIIYQLLQESAEWLHTKNLTQWQIWLNPDTTPQKIKMWVEDSFAQNEFYFVKNITQNDIKNETKNVILCPEIMGMYRLMYEDKMFWGNDTTKAGYVHSFVVRRQYAGENLGAKILLEIENTLKNQQISLMRLDCNASNPALCAYYEKQDFKKVGEKTMDWGINNLYEKKI